MQNTTSHIEKRAATSTKPEIGLVELSPRGKRFLSAMLREGEHFNELSVSSQIRLIEVSGRQDLFHIRGELVSAGYIITEKIGNRVHCYINPDKSPPRDVQALQPDELRNRCTEVDKMEDGGERKNRHSPFQIRRREQLKVFRDVWKFFFPKEPALSDGDMRRFLSLCGDSMEELFIEIERVVEIKKDAAWYEHQKNGKGTRIKPPIKHPRAYILSSLEDHARELGITTRKRRTRNRLEDPFTLPEERR